MHDLVAEDVKDRLAAGSEALQAGDWAVARDAFEVALEREESGEAFAGLGDAHWWLGETDEAITYHERAGRAAARRRRLGEFAFRDRGGDSAGWTGS